jgi:hypothetical protein
MARREREARPIAHHRHREHIVRGTCVQNELERRLQERLDALPAAARAEILHVLMLPDFERAARIGEFLELHAEPVVRGVH